MICKNCIHKDICKFSVVSMYECEHFADGTIKNQYDRIRNMSIDELIYFMQQCGWDFPPYCDYTEMTRGLCDLNCLKCAREYLESEVDTE